MKRKYVVYKQKYERYGGGKEDLFSIVTVGETQEECITRLLGILFDQTDEADDAISAGPDAMEEFIRDSESCNGDGQDLFMIFDVEADKKVFG